MANPNQLNLSLPADEHIKAASPAPPDFDDFDRMDRMGFTSSYLIRNGLPDAETHEQDSQSTDIAAPAVPEGHTQVALHVAESESDRIIRLSNEAWLQAYAFGGINKEELPPYLRSRV